MLYNKFYISTSNKYVIFAKVSVVVLRSPIIFNSEICNTSIHFATWPKPLKNETEDGLEWQRTSRGMG